MLFHKKKKEPKYHVDKLLLGIVLALSIWGAVMVYSGSVLVAIKQNYDPSHYFIRQLIWIIIGISTGFVAYRIDYRILKKLSPYLIALSFILLITVLLVNIEQPIKRWFSLGPFDLQPSEIAKLSLFIYLASWLSKPKQVRKPSLSNFKSYFIKEFIPFLCILSLITVPIFIEPDLDTTILIISTSFIVYLIAGDDLVHFLGSIMTLLTLLPISAFIIPKASYRLERFINWKDFWLHSSIQDPYGSGYQLNQILVAIASGGLRGVGFGASRQKFYYLGDTAFSDTIFAVIAEELGFIGCLILIMCFLIILHRGYSIAKNSHDKFGFLLAISITTWITIQTIFHIGSNVALLPINGNTLPFMSYGGSSTIVNLTAIGLLLSIGKKSTTEKGGNRLQSRLQKYKLFKDGKKNKLYKSKLKNLISELFN